MQKAGAVAAAEIQKDVRTSRGKEGECTRRVATWEEAHKILAEGESFRAGDRAPANHFAMAQYSLPR